MKKDIIIFYWLIISLIITGCGPGQLIGPTLTPTSTATPTTTPTPLPPATFENIRSFPDHAQVTIIGRICLPDSQMTITGEFTSYTIALLNPDYTCDNVAVKEFNELGNRPSSSIVEVSVPNGTNKNQMRELPRFYDYSDLQLMTESGKIVGHGDIVSLTASITQIFGHTTIQREDIIAINAYP